MASPTTAPPTQELNHVMSDVTAELASMIAAGHQGRVTVHYGNNKLRVEVQRFSPETSLNAGVSVTKIAAG